MDEEAHLSFFLEWYDPQADQIKPYVLHFYGDNTLELIERNTRRTFLKRIRIPTVSLSDLYIGASISVYSRQLTIIEAANAYTKAQIQQQATKATVLVTPKGYPVIGDVITAIESSMSDLQIVNLVMMQLDASHLSVLATHFTPRLTAAQQAQQQLTRDVSVAIEVKLSSPNCLEQLTASFEAARWREVVLISDSGLERLTAASPVATTAVMDHCSSVCILRPRVLKERHVGSLVRDILATGLEISALKLVHLSMDEADEFFRVYKGIYRQYHEFLKYMTSAPCIAIELRGEDVVCRFRELCGPHDMDIATTLRPASLRARYGKSTLFNAIHCTDCPEDGQLEAQYLFATLT